MKVRQGQLQVTERGLALVREGKKGPVVAPIGRNVLGEDLQRLPDSDLQGLEVDFELDADGKPRFIRRRGQQWTVPAAAGPASGSQPRSTRDFHNPYNFVPAPPRHVGDPDLGDGPPIGHDRLVHDRWSGRIPVTLRTVTPLLILDSGKVQVDEAKHKTFPVRVGPDGHPYLPPTVLKGMLRSAFEAVTNSRFGVFVGRKDPLAYRQETSVGARMIPARVTDDGENLELLPGTTKVSSQKRQGEPLYAAAIRMYRGRPTSYEGGGQPAHGDAVTAVVRETQHRRGYRYWQVTKIAHQASNAVGRLHAESGERLIDGWVCVTNQNIGNKHDERVFFADGTQETRPLTDELKRNWKALISNYRSAHASDEIYDHPGGPTAFHGTKPGETAWSRHLHAKGADELTPADLCYALVDKKGEVTGLYPVLIGRELYPASPQELLHDSLLPASKLNECSTADRVFGWANPDGQGAYRGHVRFTTPECTTPEPIETLTDPVPLAILGQPKPQQARFYAAVDPEGTPIPDGTNKGDHGYRSGEGLRGRKVYLHHAGLPEGYWDTPLEDRTQDGAGSDKRFFQEYRRPRLNGREQRDKQNRSISGWIKSDVEFTFTIEFHNLSDVELGALLWLLSLPEGCYHRLGGAKPLGFGSVKLRCDVEQGTVSSGADWAAAYRGMETPKSASAQQAQTCIQSFEAAVVRAETAAGRPPRSFDSVPYIAAFLAAARGPDTGRPVHYPRASQHDHDGGVPPHPEGKAYEWFVANERPSGAKAPLPYGASDLGLPMQRANAPRGQGGRHRGGRGNGGRRRRR